MSLKKKVCLAAVTAFCVLALTTSAFSQTRRPRIIDGSTVSETSFPQVARLTVDGELLCTGTLIGSKYVLTAGHCFFDERNRRAVGDTDIVARLNGVEYSSARVYIHPDYRSRSTACVDGETDAAIVELTSEPPLTPIILLQVPVPLGSTVLLAGYGTQGSGGSGENGTLPAVGTINIGNTVVEGYGEEPPAQNAGSSYFYWTFDGGEANTASGDSGGPAFLQIGNDSYLAGITCGGTGNAEIGSVSFQTRCDLFAAWAQQITGTTSGNVAPGFLNLSAQSAQVGQAFSYLVPITGTQPITVSMTGGSLPPGLVFDGATIYGTPTTAGRYSVDLTATSSYGSSTTSLTIIVTGFNPSLTVSKVLLQFDYVDDVSDFLDITGKITVGPKFKPRNKRITVTIGRFRKTFRLDENAQSVGNGRSYLDLFGPARGAAFAKPTVGFDLTLERVAIFDELSTLGFPASADASEGQQVPLPISIMVNGVEASTTALLSFRSRDARWRIAK